LEVHRHAVRFEKVVHGGVAGWCGGGEFALAARRRGAELAGHGVAADGDLFDLVCVDAVDERAEWDLLGGALGRLEKAPEQKDQDDDDDPEKSGLDGGIQRMPPRGHAMLRACLTGWKRAVPYGNSSQPPSYSSQIRKYCV